MAEGLCTLTVRFDIAPDDFAVFLSLVRENAALSLQREPGCQRFDVMVPLVDAPTVLLYEIYRSRADFDRHLATEHYLRFDAETQGMVRSKTVEFFCLMQPAPVTP